MRKPSFILIFAVLALFSSSSCVAEREADDWKGKVALGFNLTDGNSNTSLLDTSFALNREVTENIWRFEAGYRYGEDSDQKNIDDMMFLGSYKRLLSNRLYIGKNIEFTKDTIANIDYRVNFAPLIGYFFLKNETFKFNVDLIPGYVFEELSGVSNDYFAPGIGERFEWQLSKRAKFYEEIRFQISAEDSDKYLISAKAGLEAPLTDSLSLVFTIDDQYDNQPAQGKRRNDLTFTSGIAYHFL